MIVDEFLDIVDETDNVIGQSRRSDVHQRGLLHRSIHLLVFNDLGELLMQKRSMKKDESPGKWCSSLAVPLKREKQRQETRGPGVVRKARGEVRERSRQREREREKGTTQGITTPTGV